MKKSEFIKLVSEMIQSEPEEFKSFIDAEDWDGLEAEIDAYADAVMEG